MSNAWEPTADTLDRMRQTYGQMREFREGAVAAEEMLAAQALQALARGVSAKELAPKCGFDPLSEKYRGSNPASNMGFIFADASSLAEFHELMGVTPPPDETQYLRDFAQWLARHTVAMVQESSK